MLWKGNNLIWSISPFYWDINNQSTSSWKFQSTIVHRSSQVLSPSCVLPASLQIFCSRNVCFVVADQKVSLSWTRLELLYTAELSQAHWKNVCHSHTFTGLGLQVQMDEQSYCRSTPSGVLWGTWNTVVASFAIQVRNLPVKYSENQGQRSNAFSDSSFEFPK